MQGGDVGRGVGNEGMHACWVGCELQIGSEADNFESKKQSKMYVGVVTLVVLWVRDGWSTTHASVVGETSAWDPGVGLVVNPRIFEEVFVGSQTRYYGGIFVRACMQNGETAFDKAKTRGYEDIAVRDWV